MMRDVVSVRCGEMGNENIGMDGGTRTTVRSRVRNKWETDTSYGSTRIKASCHVSFAGVIGTPE